MKTYKASWHQGIEAWINAARGLARLRIFIAAVILVLMSFATHHTHAQIAVRGDMIHTMAGDPIENGVVVITDGRIAAVGPADQVSIPDDYRVLHAPVVTPGLIDARATVGLTGIDNQPHDQDVIERSTAMQPELRAIDAYNTREELIEWLRRFGITTVHTGHAPGELISGQTMIVKLHGNTVEDALLVETAAVAATLGPGAQRRDDTPGTRGKMMAVLRSELIKAQEYQERQQRDGADAEDVDDDDLADDAERRRQSRGRDLRLETLGRVLDGELPLLITVNRAQDIATALRLADEFNIRLWIDSAAEAYLLTEEIKASGFPVIIHPTMIRARGELENLSFRTASILREHGIPVAMQSSYEGYVPKVRVVLFEAAVAAAHGLGFEGALETITIGAARILGIDDRVGSIEVGKDGDLALYTGDPFEYTTHCIGTIIEGRVVSESSR